MIGCLPKQSGRYHYVKIDHLRKNYGTFSLDCSLEVRPGCVTGLVGQNGAGKSTTFKALLGLISPDSGSIRIIIVGVLGLLFLLLVMGAEIAKSINIDLDALWKNPPALGMGTAIASFFGIGIALLLLSCRISIGIMERKEF